MRKMIAAMVLAVVLTFSSCLAEDLSSMSDDELISLHRKILEEFDIRGIKSLENVFAEEPDPVIERLTEFFRYWYEGRVDDMLVLCASAWKTGSENPRADLFVILANRTPLSLETVSVSGASSDPVRTVRCISSIDRNNGGRSALYLFDIVMVLEEDGLWHVDPSGLENRENAEDETPEPDSAETSAPITGSTPLYYVPEGGTCYHLDPECKTVNERYLPMADCFLYSELSDEKYRNLKPCRVCEAPAAEADQPLFRTFGEAVDAAGEYPVIGGSMEYIAVVFDMEGRCIRVVSMLDDRAAELNQAAMEADPEDFSAAMDSFNAYVLTLPVAYSEEFSALPKDRSELDALAGKTVRELVNEGFTVSSSGGGENDPVIFTMAYGLYNYDFEADADFAEYLEREAADDLESLTVRNAVYSGPSMFSTDLRYHADGTFESGEDFSSEDYRLMLIIADEIYTAWNGGNVDKEALIVYLTEKYPEAAWFIREMVESYTTGMP